MILKNLFRFVILILLQVLVLNNIRVGGYINPYFYIYFILLLPFETPGWILLLSSFFLGISVDFFSNTLGINAAASVLMAFCRPLVIRLLTSSREYETGIQPGIKDLGFSWFFFYALLLIIVHHTTLFFLEVFRFTELKTIIYRICLSSIVTLFLSILAQYLFYKREK